MMATLENMFATAFAATSHAIESFCTVVFKPVLAPIFVPIDTFLGKIYQPWASFCAVGLFVGTMLWVGVLLNKDYVNRGRPYKSIWSDLRLWTVISMTPHVLVYLYFY